MMPLGYAPVPQTKPTRGASVYDGLDPQGTQVSGYGYVICAFVFLEGVLLLLHNAGILLPELFFYEPTSKSPLKAPESIYLWFVAIGDILSAVLGIIGIWSGHNLWPQGWREFSKVSGTTAMVGTGAVLAWRWLVLLSVAPWAGIWMGFEPGVRLQGCIFISLYLLLSIFVVFTLSRVFTQTMADSLALQSHLDEQHRHERKQLLYNADQARQSDFHADGESMHDHEVEPFLFGVFPLAECITLYSLIITFFCVVALLWLLFTGGTSSGGWAFFAYKPQATTTFWLEFLVYVVSIGIGVFGVMGCMLFVGVSTAIMREHVAVNCLMVFLLGSMFRFAMIFAVTGMAFLESNTCGLYVHGLAQMAYSSAASATSAYGLSCRPVEYVMILLTLGFCVLDGYLIWGTFKLWHFAQDWKVVQADDTVKGADYGTSLEDNKAY